MPGAKGVPEDMLRKAASMAVCKINIDSDLRLAMTATIRKFMAENPGAFDPRQYLGPARMPSELSYATRLLMYWDVTIRPKCFRNAPRYAT